MLKKIWTWIKSIWKDPVWSKVISAIIIASGIAIWARVENKSLADICQTVLNLFNFKVPLYFVLSLLGLLLVFPLLKRLFKKKQDPIANVIVGHFTFQELFNILVDDKIEYGTNGMSWSGQKPPSENVLTQFDMFAPIINRGVDFESRLDDAGYLYGILCPHLLKYGLVTKEDRRDEGTGLILTKYETSQDGYKFLALLEKYNLRQRILEDKNKKNK